MKKYLGIAAVVVFILLFIILKLPLGASDKYNICSQILISYFCVNNNNYFAEFSSGQREINFDYDGISNKKTDYGVFKIKLKTFTGYANNINVSVKINDKITEYILDKNPFDNSFMCDIETLINNDAKIKILVDNIDINYTELNCISNGWNVGYNKAFNVGYNNLNDYIKQKNKNNINCECFLTVTSKTQNNEIICYWIFSVKSSDLKTKNILIDVNNCEIILKN